MEKITVNRWDDNEYAIATIQNGIPDDILISRISYEPRSSGVLKKLDKNYKAKTGLFIVGEKFEKFTKVQDNKKEIINILKRSSFFNDHKTLKTSIDNPIKIIMEIDKIIKNSFTGKQKLNITFDITAFPRGELLTVIYYLRHLPIIDTLRILYISPNKYGEWLTNGYRYSMIPPFFEGPPTFEKMTALLILTGFEFDRAISLIDEIQPSFLILGKSSPGTSKEFDDIGDEIINKLKSTRKITKETYKIAGNNPFRCRDTFREIIQEYSQFYDFFVATLGTKLELLGVYLAYEENSNFRIIYPVPLIYNVGNYSTGCRDIYEMLLKKE